MATLFIDACIKGQVRLSPNVARRISEAEMDPLFKIPNALSRQLFEIRQPTWGLLEIADFQPPLRGSSHDGWVKYCVVRTEGHDLATAWRTVARFMSNGQEPRLGREVDFYQIDYPAKRYLVHVCKTLMYSVIFDETAAAKRLAAQPNSVRGRAMIKGTDWIFE